MHNHEALPVAVHEVAGEGGIVEGKVPGPARTPPVVVEHDPAQALHIRLEETLSATPAFNVIQLALVVVIPVFPAVFPKSYLHSIHPTHPAETRVTGTVDLEAGDYTSTRTPSNECS